MSAVDRRDQFQRDEVVARAEWPFLGGELHAHEVRVDASLVNEVDAMGVFERLVRLLAHRRRQRARSSSLAARQYWTLRWSISDSHRTVAW